MRLSSAGSLLGAPTCLILEDARDARGPIEDDLMALRDLQHRPFIRKENVSERGSNSGPLQSYDVKNESAPSDKDLLLKGECSDGRKPHESIWGHQYQVVGSSSDRGKPRVVFRMDPVSLRRRKCVSQS